MIVEKYDVPGVGVVEINTDCTENVDAFWEIIETYDFSREEVMRLFLNYHGLQLLEPEFLEEIIRNYLDITEPHTEEEEEEEIEE